MFLGLLTGPIANPFRINHERRKPRDELRLGTAGHSHLTWQKKELPGAGAGQYAYETYGLPPYAAYGFGNIHVTSPLKETFPASYVFQSVGIVGIPPSSMVQGQFVTQPLMDSNFATQAGIVIPGAISNGPNAIINGSPSLAP